MIKTMEEFRKKYYPKAWRQTPLTPQEIGKKLAEESLEILRRELKKR